MGEDKEPLPSAETAEDILGADDLEIVAIRVPEWKKTVHLRTLSAQEGIEISEQLSALTDDRKTEALRLILTKTLCTAAGTPLLTTAEQCQRIYDKNPAVLDRLQNEAMKLQGWRDEDGSKNASSGAAPVASPIA